MARSRLNQVAEHLGATIIPNSDSTNAAPYQISEEPLGTTRRLRILGIGAGMSSMNMIRTLRLHLKDYEHVVYEKNPVLGGTWYENRYPGCKCDVPSHNYQFSWRPNHEWKGFFSSASEIQAYLLKVAEEENMNRVIKTEHQIERAEWDEHKGQWNVKVRNLKSGDVFDDYAHFLLDSCGILNNWKWPTIPGLHSFKGELIHSANWPETFNYKGKTLALIGNGSSGVQILPELQKEAQHIVHFVRDPTWVVPSRLQLLVQGSGDNIIEEVEIDEDQDFTPAQVQRFKTDPAFYRKFVKAVEEVVNGNFPLQTLKDTEFAAILQEKAKEYMREALNGDKHLCDAIIPKFPLGCRRLTPAISYLDSLQKPNVRVVTDPIKEITAEGLLPTMGETIKVDAIVCATGFDVSFCPRFPIIGRNGNLQDIWTHNLPKSYMSCAVPDFPNYFTFLGPSAPIGHGSVFTITEHIAKYLTRIIKKCQMEKIKAVVPSHSAVDELFEHMQSFMSRTAWSGNCISWFKNGTLDGPVIALHPGSRIHFFHMLETFRGEDWEYTYLKPKNRFQYLGNGFSTKENSGEDSTWYLDHPDEL
ncbi:monooxygenase [Colletotrichum truncatum]|uniref:Monooxygenase n=1 Tax=Colletotrichum truncatum TaxID=5467 RepID=A0ACC3YWF2_COLTU|nr:monooxygenase [Colletotrichum truncatum]KAF6781193.1 monooxygenase [Colletotrichum truncatum]